MPRDSDASSSQAAAVTASLHHVRAIWRGHRSLITFIALACLALFAAEAWVAYTSRSQQLTIVRINQENLAKSVSEYTAKTLAMAASAIDVAATIAQHGAKAGSDQSMPFSILSSMLTSAPELRLIMVLDEDGRAVIDTFGPNSDRRNNFSDRDYYIFHRDHPAAALFVGAPFVSRFDGSWVLTVSRRIARPDGAFGGVAVAAIHMSALQAFFQSLDLGPNGAVGLIRDDGVLLARRPYNPSRIGQNLSESALFTQQLPRSPIGTDVISLFPDGRSRYLSYRRIQGFPVVVTVSIPEEAVLADWRAETIRSSMTSIGLALALLLFGAFVIRSTRRRIRQDQAATATTLQANVRLLEQTVVLHNLASDLDAARRRAEAASRAKSEFLANISHELRTPLNAVIGFAGLLEMKIVDPKCLTYLSYIRQGGEMLTSRINEILDLAAIETGKAVLTIERVNLSELIEFLAATLRPIAENSGVTIIAPAPEPPIWVHADKARLGQVFENLGSNGVKYNRPGGFLTIAVERNDRGWIRVSFTDTGRGVPTDRQNELFGRFNRLGADMDAIPGAGIGLSICRDLMALMKGSIGFSSREGVGSVFWIELPEADLVDAAEAAEIRKSA